MWSLGNVMNEHHFLENCICSSSVCIRYPICERGYNWEDQWFYCERKSFFLDNKLHTKLNSQFRITNIWEFFFSLGLFPQFFAHQDLVSKIKQKWNKIYVRAYKESSLCLMRTLDLLCFRTFCDFQFPFFLLVWKNFPMCCSSTTRGDLRVTIIFLRLLYVIFSVLHD